MRNRTAMSVAAGLLAALVVLRGASAQDVTVVQPTPSGGITVISTEDDKEVTTTIVTTNVVKVKKPAPKVITKTEVVQVLPTQPRKARVAVIPTTILAPGVRSKFERELYEKLGIADPSVLEHPGYTGHLIDALVNCRKFDVLERAALRETIKELRFGESEYADPKKCVKLGQVLNADYVVVSEIRYLLVRKQAEQVPFVGQTRDKYWASIGTRVRVVDVATSRICSSNMGEADLKVRDPWRPEDRAKLAVTFIDQVFQKSARAEAGVIIDVVYPIRVIAHTGNQVTLNRGKGAIKKDELLYLYRPGQVLVDPDTNETLGYQETPVGKIKVVRVDPKVSVADVVELESGQAVNKMDIARRRAREPFKRTNLPPNEERPRID